jgi:hypothetical protein
MKKCLIFSLILFSFTIYGYTQDTILLDGKKIPKNELNPYNGLGYKIDLTKPENKRTLSSSGIEDKWKVTSQYVYASKGMKSFAQATAFGRIDSADYFLPSSKLKFFDENGMLKWEKKLEGKIPLKCYLSPDGKNSIFNITVYTKSDEEFGGQNNSLSIFDDKGNTIFEHTTPIKYIISTSLDIICYQEDIDFTKNKEDENSFYCIDLKTGTKWGKTFSKKVFAEPFSTNGDYIRAVIDSFYIIYDRQGNEIFKKNKSEFGGHIDALSNDGNYVLTFINKKDGTSYFDIYNVSSMERIRTYYLDVCNEKSMKLYNGGDFVNNCHYLVALTAIIAPSTAMIIFHNLKGEYIGHKVYYDIKCGFFYPAITLLEDGSFEVYMDSYYLGNLKFPGVNTLQYLKK